LTALPTTRPESAPSAAADEIELSIVMPCLNEVRTLEVCIRKAKGFLESSGIRGEIIVADNGSTDGSQELATRLGARVVNITEKGYGAALAGGFAAARGKYIIMGDSDDSYDFSNGMPFVEKLREGYDLVMGNRFKGGILNNAMPKLHRYFGNPGLTFLGRLFFGSPCGDFYCGQRGFRRQAILVKATMSGLKITEVPVTLQPDGRDRRPHLRSWRDGWRSLRFYLLYSPRWLFFYPGLALMLIGLVAGAVISIRPIEIAGVTLDVHTLIYCAAATIMGFQLVMLSIFSKAIAISTRLHPRNPRFERMLTGTSLEIGLILGGVLLVIGIVLSILAILRWAEGSFGDLDPFRVMRLVVPAMLSLTLGVQVMSSSFYLSLLQIQRKKLMREST
jgi:glycosyltransferase involved in cell wall biosynthesis